MDSSRGMKTQLVFPMAFYVFYMWCLAVYVFRTRLRAIQSGQVPAKYFKTFAGDLPPERVVLVARHYDNQFQVPLLFFIGCVLHIVLGQANNLTLILAWGFVMSRGLHSWIHLGRNSLQRRVMAFALGWLVIVLLWAQLVYFAVI